MLEKAKNQAFFHYSAVIIKSTLLPIIHTAMNYSPSISSATHFVPSELLDGALVKSLFIIQALREWRGVCFFADLFLRYIGFCWVFALKSVKLTHGFLLPFGI